VLAALAAFAITLAPLVIAQEALREQATGAEFPATVAFEHAGRAYALRATGLAVRRVAFFKVYGMAHYADTSSAVSNEEMLDWVLTESAAKQVTMHFARDIAGPKISDSLVKSLRRNASEETLRTAAPAIEQFATAVRHDVRAGQRFTVRWLPGGVTVCMLDGEEVLVMHNASFALALWSMWFGDRAVVDRNSLLAIKSASGG